MKAVDKVLDLALAEVGYLEKASNAQLDDKTANAGKANYTKYARDLDAVGYIFNGKKNGHEWCCIFAIWPFVEAFGAALAMKLLGLPQKSSAAGVKSLAGYFKAAGRFFAVPQPGDFTFFYTKDLTGWAHTALVERVEAGMVYTIEGNTSGASGVVSNGGGVARKSYPLTYNRIAGYGRPDWGLVEDDGASVWARASTEKAKNAGVFAGNENGDFRWQESISREELAIVLDRLGLLG